MGMEDAVTRRRLHAIGWVIATVATVGSLYYQYGMGLYPCELCWFQRIAMYPLVVILGYGTIVDLPDTSRLTGAFAGIGLLIALYHSFIQYAPEYQCVFQGCGLQYELFGVLAIPNQAAIAFATIIAIIAIAAKID